MKNVIIVESPSKCKTIEGYIGKEYLVVSSKGHIRDLSTSGPGGLGIDIANEFHPIYNIIKEKKTLVKELLEKCKDARVLLATDPDREGEAISWHLAKVLNLSLDDENRIVFNEITKNAILEALKKPRRIDRELVESQETRRILDRIIGFKLSKLLNSKISAESAGRVQSVALKLIVDLEKKIDSFVPEDYWTIDADFGKYKAQAEKYKNKKLVISSQEECDNYLSQLNEEFLVSNVEVKKVNKESRPPYITSTMQQEASTKLNFDSSRTMRVAQSLYEGKEVGGELTGLITYMRTDSDRLSDSFVNDALKYIEATYGAEYCGKKKHKNTVGSQDAHEGIRPTSIKRTPNMLKDCLTKDEFKLYTLIYERAITSLMAPAVNEVTNITLDNNGLIFKTQGVKNIFDGYYKVLGLPKEDTLPEIKEGNYVKAKEVSGNKHSTTPPARYTEARLIKDMEELGIGRPSTYAQTIKNNKDRKYIRMEEKKIVPTEKGKLAVDSLDGYFSEIINVSFTANMEKELDLVAQDEMAGKTIVKDFWESFEPMIKKATEKMPKVLQYTGNICPECGSPLVTKKGKYGYFEACSSYPKCVYIVKNGALATPLEEEILCPKCKEGHIIVRTAMRGKGKGKEFFGCDKYPKCKFTSTYKPTGEICKLCGSALVESPDGVKCMNLECEASA